MRLVDEMKQQSCGLKVKGEGVKVKGEGEDTLCLYDDENYKHVKILRQ